MRIKIEYSEANSDNLSNLIANAIEGYMSELKQHDLLGNVSISSINIYIAAQTSDHMTVNGFEDGDIWIAKPVEYEPCGVFAKYENPKVICNQDGVPILKAYSMQSPQQISQNYVAINGLTYLNT